MNNNQLSEISWDELFEMDDVDITSETKEVDVDTEIEQEEDKPESQEQGEEPIEEETPIIEPSIFHSLLKEKLESGVWDGENTVIEIDGEEVKLSELEDLDEDTYNQILFSANNLKTEEDFKEGYIKLDSLDETKKSLVNLIIAGDLEKAKELFEKPEQLIEPFKGYESDNETHNEQVLRWYYQQQGNSDKEVEALLKISKEDLTLESKANKIVDWQREQFKNKIKVEEEKVLAEKALEQENLKKYRKDVNAEFKALGIDDGLARRYADVASKYDANGELEVDKKYDEWMKDPKKAVKLIELIFDEESYNKRISAETKRKAQLDLATKANVIKITKKAQTVTPKKEELDNPFPDMVFD